jgi:hypothetical protein
MTVMPLMMMVTPVPMTRTMRQIPKPRSRPTVSRKSGGDIVRLNNRSDHDTTLPGTTGEVVFFGTFVSSGALVAPVHLSQVLHFLAC